jgi:hypothetical protein
MSTKTTFKRVALVAVASLGLSLVAVAPSNAFVQQWTVSQTSGSTAVAPAATATGVFNFSFAASTPGAISIAGATIWSEPATSGLTSASLNFDGTPIASLTNSNITLGDQNGNAGTKSIWYKDNSGNNNWAGYSQGIQFMATAAGRASAYTTLTFSPDVVGTYVIRVYGAPNATTAAIYTDWTVVVAPKGAITAAGSTLTPSSTNITGAKTQGVLAGTVGIAANNALANADAAVLSATVSGPGLVSFTGAFANAGRNVSQGANNTGTISIYGDGTPGVGTISIYSGSTLLGAQTVTFYGALASLKATASKTVFGGDVTASLNAGAAVADTYGVLLQGLDAAGVEVPLLANTVTVTTSNADAFDAATTQGTLSDDTGNTGKLLVSVDADTVNAVGGDTSVMTYTVGTISTTATLTFGLSTVLDSALVTVAFDKAEYSAGEKAIITVTGKDKGGKALADGVVTLTGIVASSSLSDSVTLAAATGAGVAGVKSYTVYMPLGVGPVTVTASLAGQLVGKSVTATATVLSDGVAMAAQAAAEEATAAANDATDAALSAAEAAEAATAMAQEAVDAVAELSAQVTSLIAALRAQITSLTNLVIKIQKKMKA